MSSKKNGLAFVSDFGNKLLMDIIYKLGKWFIQKVSLITETLALLVLGLATFLKVKLIVAQLIIVLMIIGFFVLLLILKSKSRADEKESQKPSAEEIKTGMYVASRYGRMKYINIISALKVGNTKPLFKALHLFKFTRFRLNDENVFPVKSDYAFLQASFIVRNQANELAIFQRLGKELSSLPKLLTGCSILRSFSPATLRRGYLIESILYKIGLKSEDDIMSIRPYGIGYNETTKENSNFISYFFIIYELVVKTAPEAMHRYGDNQEINKPGEKFLGFYPLNSYELSECKFKGSLDRKILGRLNRDEEMRSADNPGECLFIPSDIDVLKIRI
ncbi:MAG: hypothetical protein WCS62_04865 [Bacilli bacterium]